jgi:hypothetical protein
MTRLVALSGKVSQISPTGARFMVDDRPASYRGYPIVGEGDLVTIAGLEREGVVDALAIRNRSTGVDYGGASLLQYLLFGFAVLMGLFTVTVGGLGLLFLALAGWVGSRLRRSARALRMVRGRG